MLSEQYQKAIEFAAIAHDGQKRKGDGIPYISHPYAVATILQNQGCDEYVVIAGLLHDTVEDTPVTLEQIQREFGEVVAELVDLVTEPSKSVPWEERKNHMLNVIKTAPAAAKYLCCADKLHNLRSLVRTYREAGDDMWTRFSRGYEKQKWYAESMVQSLFYGLEAEQQKAMFFEYKQTVEDFYHK